jgi:pimeloyl-ACP methyl ester carboxylesterase
MTDVVLIHSTGQSAEGWDRVIRELEARGAHGHAIDLPNDPSLRAGDFARITAQRFAGLHRPVVVAHSGSGPLLPAIAEALDASRQTWLAAWVPDPAASFNKDARANLGAAFIPGWVGKDPIADADVAEQFLYHDCDDEQLAWALTTRREFYPAAVYDEQIALYKRAPCSYILATQDRTIRPEWQERMARERLGVEPVTIEAGHCPNVSRPAELAELLLA